jgi:hypothetical protein
VSLNPAVRAAITRHLYDREPVNGVKYVSSLIAFLGDARTAAGRDSEGRLQPGRRGESWLAATAYLGLLDQIGTTFMVAGTRPTGRAIEHALRAFSTIQDQPTLDVLYALRCALVHDYSLANPGCTGGKATDLTHFFRLTADSTTPLIQFPSVRWDGNYANVSRQHETLVNLQKVGDLAEDVVDRLRAEHRAGTLDIRLGLEEFEHRYGICFPC